LFAFVILVLNGTVPTRAMAVLYKLVWTHYRRCRHRLVNSKV